MDLALQYAFAPKELMYNDAIQILYNFNIIMRSKDKLSHDECLSIVEFLSFDELRLLYMSNSNIKYLRTAFELRTDSLPWVLNIVVKTPLGWTADYVYKSKDILFTALNVGSFDLYLCDIPIIGITSEQLDSISYIKEIVGNDIVMRGKRECLRIVIMRGVGGKIPLSSFYMRDLNIPLHVTRINDVNKCSIRGKKITIRNISYDTSMIDKTYFSTCRLKRSKPRCG